MNIRQRDLVLLPYPFTDMSGSKVRPALVVSNDSFNKSSADCVMVPLTSVLKDAPHSVMIKQSDLSSGTLVVTSRVRADKLFCVEKGLVLTKIGCLAETKFGRIRAEILSLF
jgi:mRNA interferase MazF